MDIWKIQSKNFQYNFLKSEARYPAFVSGWATGKSLFGILKGLELSKKYPGNLGLIARREFTDLRDSTIKDFERYTGKHINEGNKEYKFKNGSLIMFRHARELDTLKNVNLGWFWIEQAEELDTEEQFTFLVGRLRREGGVKFRTGFITANVAGHNWVWQLWKKNKGSDSDYPLSEATTLDNADVLPDDYIQSLEKLEGIAPSVYNRFVLNKWDATVEGDMVIPYELAEGAVNRQIKHILPRRLVVVDPARFGDDKTVIYAMEDGQVIDTEIYGQKDTMETTGKCIAMRRKHNAQLHTVDVIGIGAGIVDRLSELNEKVIAINSAEKSGNITYKNLRTEMWFNAQKMFREGKVSLPTDEMLLQELSACKFKYNSDGTIGLEPKEKTKLRLGRSPDRADALIYGLWGLQYVKVKPPHREIPVSEQIWEQIKEKKQGGDEYLGSEF